MIGVGTGKGSNVSGVIIGGKGIGGMGAGGGGVVFEPCSRQHSKPSKPNKPNSPGHHFQQSFDSPLSMIIGAGVGVAGLSITITFVLGALCG